MAPQIKKHHHYVLSGIFVLLLAAVIALFAKHHDFAAGITGLVFVVYAVVYALVTVVGKGVGAVKHHL